jgi:hypothetical protein
MVGSAGLGGGFFFMLAGLIFYYYLSSIITSCTEGWRPGGGFLGTTDPRSITDP